jgi:hypothetical protein
VRPRIWASGHWNHICATIAANGIGRIYRDGVQVDEKSGQTLASSILRGDISLGRKIAQWHSSYPFNLVRWQVIRPTLPQTTSSFMGTWLTFVSGIVPSQ